MKLLFTGRHFEITKPIKDFTLEKLKSHLRFMDDIIEVHVILSIEKYRHIAEITVKGKKITFSGKEETLDMYSSIAAVLEKIEKQAKRRKEKFTTRKKKGQASGGASGTYNPDEEQSEEEAAGSVRAENLEEKQMAVQDEVLQMDDPKK